MSLCLLISEDIDYQTCLEEIEIGTIEHNGRRWRCRLYPSICKGGQGYRPRPPRQLPRVTESCLAAIFTYQIWLVRHLILNNIGRIIAKALQRSKD